MFRLADPRVRRDSMSPPTLSYDLMDAPARQRSRNNPVSMVCAIALALAFAALPAAAPSQARAQATAEAVTPEALRQAVSDDRVAQFYQAGQWKPVWSSASKDTLSRAIADAERHGINAGPFLATIGSSGGSVEQEAGLTLVALSYADALASGLADPTKLRDIYTLERNRIDAAAGLRRALQAGRLAEWLASLAPQDARYRALSDTYLRVKDSVGEARPPDIPAGEVIRPGDTDPRVEAITARLRRLGHLPGGQARGRAGLYSPALVGAVKALQREHGIAVDGIVGPDTLEALNTSAGDRARQLALNLERRRWLTRTPAATRVDVNTAATVLTYVRDGKTAWTTRVVAGRPDWATPAIGAPFSQLVVNPPWYVPQSIVEAEIKPKGEDYLRRNNMHWENGTIVQEPGPDAALGLVKFDMQNPHAIYLHDTPAKSLFERNQRHLSHGCVRVEDAVAFARMLARDQGREAEFEKALQSGETRVVELGTEIPVRLLYHTAYVDDSGSVVFRPDAYGWDEELAKALGMRPADRKAGQAPVVAVSLGPSRLSRRRRLPPQFDS